MVKTVKSAEQVVQRLLEDEDDLSSPGNIDWSPDPEAEPISDDFTIERALKREGFEREPGEYWYLAANLDDAPLFNGTKPDRLQIMADPRFTEKYNELSVWLFFYQRGALATRTLLYLHQRESGSDEEFVPVIHALSKAVKHAATVILPDYEDVDKYATALARLIVPHVPQGYRDQLDGFLHYHGR